MKHWITNHKHTLLATFIVVTAFIFFFPQKYVTIDEYNYLGNAYLLSQGELRQQCSSIPGQFPLQEEICVFKYNIGTSFFLLPAATVNINLGYITSLTVFVLSIFLFASLLNHFNLRKKYIYLFAFFPPFIYYSRTLLSEIYSVFLITLVFWLIVKLWKSKCMCIPIILGFVTGLAVLVRYSNFLPLAILILGYAWQNRQLILKQLPTWVFKTTLVIFGGSVPLLIFLWINTYLYGSPFTSGYSLSGEQSLSFGSFLPHLLAFFVALNLMYPLMLVAPWFYSKRRKVIFFSLPIVSLVLLYAAGPNLLFEGRLLDLIFGIRFVLPAIPLAMLGYLLTLKEQKWLKDWMLNILIIFLAILVVALNIFHYTFLEQNTTEYPPLTALTTWSE